MLTSVEAARSTIDLELYRVDPGPLWRQFFDHLARAAARGVRVRLLVDSFGSRRMSVANWRAVEDAGIRVLRTPTILKTLLRDRSMRRDHRKLLVVDGQSAFTGGMSVDDTFFHPEGEPTWRESMVLVRGPIVEGMQRAFEEAWHECGGPRSVLPAATAEIAGGAQARMILSTPAQPCGESLFVSAILGARRLVLITNPFVVPSVKISAALTHAAKNGVDVRLLVPGRHHRFAWVRDAMRAFYDQYLRVGVRIFEYEAAMLHAKTIAVDSQWASVGSFNLDPRSFVFNDEIAVAACDAEFARSVVAAFAADCDSAREVQLTEWSRRGLLSRSREAAAMLVRRYL
ncbi:MAG: phospholipase D-like domain-containing protein [Acidobacteriota bacterium]